MGILFTICKKLLPLETGMDARQEQLARLSPDMILLLTGFTTRAWCTATITVSPSSLCLLYITEELLATSAHDSTDRRKMPMVIIAATLPGSMSSRCPLVHSRS